MQGLSVEKEEVVVQAGEEVMKVVFIAGSFSDVYVVQKIVDGILLENIPHEVFYCSAHRETSRLLEIIKEQNESSQVVFVTLAGLSNALSGVVAANTNHLVIACPVFVTPTDYLADIHSTLRMPSGVPVLTVLSPENCIMAIKRIVDTWR